MATDPVCRTGVDPRLEASQSASTVNSPHQSNDARRAGTRALGLTRRDKVPRSPGRPMLPEAVTLTANGELPSTGAYDGPRTGRGIRLGGKCTHQAGITAGGSPNGSPRTAVSHTGRVEFREPAERSYPFASKRFHVLLNSLFKVLFNFPSRYLSAIGLVSVFSLRWSLPPALGCIPKQPDSKDDQRDAADRQ
jgi:hypothetical protein